jgi:hypothetical protein
MKRYKNIWSNSLMYFNRRKITLFSNSAFWLIKGKKCF